jgi:L-lactate permease
MRPSTLIPYMCDLESACRNEPPRGRDTKLDETARRLIGSDPATLVTVNRDGSPQVSVGQTITLGTWMAGAGGAFALISPILGWLGVAVTGSDTSSNSLFGALQVTAAAKAGLSPVLMAASNSSGGVLGKMISPQNLAIAAAAVGVHGKEGDIFRRVIIWSLVFVVFMCALSGLQASVLSWMVR